MVHDGTWIQDNIKMCNIAEFYMLLTVIGYFENLEQMSTSGINWNRSHLLCPY